MRDCTYPRYCIKIPLQPYIFTSYTVPKCITPKYHVSGTRPPTIIPTTPSPQYQYCCQHTLAKTRLQAWGGHRKENIEIKLRFLTINSYTAISSLGQNLKKNIENNQYVGSIFEVQQWTMASACAGCNNPEPHHTCTWKNNNQLSNDFSVCMGGILEQ